MLTVFASMGALGVPGAAAAAPRPKYRRSHWRPYISGFSIFFGILGASAGLILLQQYAILFPSLRVVIIGEALGLVAAIVFPSLMRIRRVRRYGRRLANRERREALVARPASPAPPPPPPPSPSGWR